MFWHAVQKQSSLLVSWKDDAARYICRSDSGYPDGGGSVVLSKGKYLMVIKGWGCQRAAVK
jgi:hypothetical protein